MSQVPALESKEHNRMNEWRFQTEQAVEGT